MLKLYNTLSHSLEEFLPIRQLEVGIYSCGPTVYDYQHIGHMRRYVGDDTLIRVLQANGYKVHHVMNITDVGHLVSDADAGEDKMEKGAKKFNKSVWDIAKMFEEQFKNSCKELNINLPKDLMHATDYIKEQISLVQILEKKGYTYEIAGDGVYFDTSKFPDYFKLSRQDPDELKKGARVEFIEGKKNPSDFALWKFSKNPPSFDKAQDPALPKREMEWESPWHVGFPGWHIECSAMSIKALTDYNFDPFDKSFDSEGRALKLRLEELRVDGKKNYTIDIHTGGIDHINIHHTNEIAQSECATGEKFVNYWVHHNFLIVEGQKMSKSLNNFYTVQDVVEKGYDPLSLRYLYLQTHYRQEMNFTWDALNAAQNSLNKLRNYVTDDPLTSANISWMKKFMDALNDDLNTSKALSFVWEMVKDENILPGEKKSTLLEMDIILGLELDKKTEKSVNLSDEVRELVKSREEFRKAGDFTASDEIRKKIEDLGFEIEDSKEGPKVRKK